MPHIVSFGRLTTLLFWLAFYLCSGSVAFEAKYPNSNVSVIAETALNDAYQLFKGFLVKHNRTYVDDHEEYYKRLQIFKESLLRQAMLNTEEQNIGGSAVYGINQFSDWTPQEFKDFLKRCAVSQGGSSLFDSCSCPIPIIKLNASITKKWDWNKEGKVTPVKNQGKCGSCWAFTATECIETQWALAGHSLTQLSVQEFISCSKPDGCAGGNTCQALGWLQHKRFTLVPSSEYPYDDTSSPCKTDVLTEPGVKIKCGCCLRNVSEEEIMKPVIARHGPLAVNVDATMWHDYLGGIIQHHCTDSDINHAVQITGYDEETGPVPYWIVRNSWGESFGDNGYLYIKMGDNLCGVRDSPSFVIV